MKHRQHNTAMKKTPKSLQISLLITSERLDNIMTIFFQCTTSARQSGASVRQ